MFSRSPLILKQSLSDLSAAFALISLFLLAGCGSAADVITDSPSEVQPVATEPSPHDEATKEPIASKNVVEHRVKGNPVSTTLKLARNHIQPGETIEISVQFEVAPLWEIRTMDAQPADLATRLELDLPAGLQATGAWITPAPERSMSPDRHPAYTGKIEFRRKISVSQDAKPGTQRVSCGVSYQACDEHRCLKPAEIKLQVPLILTGNQ
ncbi:MAG: hypothetical protein KDA77_07980 [Planctomycetaceae bacterium]|nr:hypothetical protein [Planctomycetaceae bacterium]